MNFSKIAGIVAALLLTAGAVVWAQSKSEKAVPEKEAAVPAPALTGDFKKPDADQLKAKLSPAQFAVTQECGTEPPFRNAYWNNHNPGIYVDVVSGEALFSSLDKFDSGSGWPSFTAPIKGAEITEKKDATRGMVRTEVRSKVADSHLGHLFDDGPSDKGGMRYCINSAALKFIPVAEMEKDGYGKYLAPFVAAGLVKASSQETAILAGGCFWGMEEIIRQLPGVVKTTVGYSGGTTENPTYKEVCTGGTGHAESIEIVFDTNKLSYEGLLGYFFRMHDPTTLNRQHNDRGTQYRSAIFYTTEEQKKTAASVIAKLTEVKKFDRPIVTEVTRASAFYPAEEYHQKYLVKNPGGYTCHVLRD